MILAIQRTSIIIFPHYMYTLQQLISSPSLPPSLPLSLSPSLPPSVSPSLPAVVEVQFSAGSYLTREEAGSVEVCLTIDGPIATPLYVNVSAEETLPTSAEGKP